MADENVDDTKEVTAEPVADQADELPAAWKKKVFIPFVIPFESRAANETQKGMGAFGAIRNPVTKGKDGKYHPEKNQSEGVLSQFIETNRYATQKGSGGFGKRRLNITKPTGGKELEDEGKRFAALAAIPRQAGGNVVVATQSGQSLGAIRQQVMKVQYREDMTPRMDPESETFIQRSMVPNPINHAGSSVLDQRRKMVTLVGEFDRRTHSEIPRVFDTRMNAPCTGTGAGTFGLGPFRSVTFGASKFGYEQTYDEVVASKNAVPWVTRGGTHQSQAGTGGYHQVRDVVSKTSDAIRAKYVKPPRL